MYRREFMQTVGAAAGCVSLSGCGARTGFGAADKRPNIIYIMLDEWGYYEMSSLGHDKIKTPNIDRFVAEGMRFTQWLAGAPVCAPTRSVLMTGQHSGHTTIRANDGFAPLREDDFTLAAMLKQAGYATGGFGKWGCGGRGTSGIPENHGFDEFFGYYDQVHAHTYFPSYLIHNSEEVPLEGNPGDLYEGETFAHNLIAGKAMEFIERNAGSPFFCYCPWAPPHGLWGIDEADPAWREFKDKPWEAGQRRPRDARVYAALLAIVDRQVGQIVDLLQRHGIANDTVIFLCGDNGGQDYFHENRTYPRGFFAPNVNPVTGEQFRGEKRSLLEGGLRIPMIVRWPGMIAAGTVSEHLCYFPDVMPTLADIAGIDVPSNTDGISVLPTLTGESNQEQHEYLYWEYGDQRAVRIGNLKGYRSGGDAEWELYDLSRDIGEENDLAADFPDLIERIRSIAEQAHTPQEVGEVYDRVLIEKDRREGQKRLTGQRPSGM